MNRIKDYAKDEAKDRLIYLSPAAMMLLCDVILWCEQKQLSCQFTSAFSDFTEDQALNRISSTHREGRAFDLSTRGWGRETILECKRIFTAKYRTISAIDEHKEPRLCVIHDAGSGEHIHFQVHPRYAMLGKIFNKI